MLDTNVFISGVFFSGVPFAILEAAGGYRVPLGEPLEKETRVASETPIRLRLVSFVFKTVGIADFLRGSLAEIGDIRAAFIYGSVAPRSRQCG